MLQGTVQPMDSLYHATIRGKVNQVNLVQAFFTQEPSVKI